MAIFGGKRIQELEAHLQGASQRIAYLEAQIHHMGGGDLVRTHDAISAAQRQLGVIERDAAARVEHIRALDRDIAGRQAELDQLHHELGLGQANLALADDGLYPYRHPADSSVALAEELASVRAAIKATVANKTATTATANFTFNNSAAKGRKFVADMSKLMLRSYNAEAENGLVAIRVGRLEAAITRLDRAKAQAERLGSMIDLRISPTYHDLRIKELRLAARHLGALQVEKEAEAERRARLREERIAQREFEAERERLRKEQAHYTNAIAKLIEQGRVEEAEALRNELQQIEAAIADVDYRKANIRAGYVYVISNVGAFGDQVIKIGMTRRLDPIDRVNELGDASVPFGYDVHTLFFSEDAVGVEAALHRAFARQRVNLVNERREFFYATPAQVRAALGETSGAVLEFRGEASAEQFRKSEELRAAFTTDGTSSS